MIPAFVSGYRRAFGLLLLVAAAARLPAQTPDAILFIKLLGYDQSSATQSTQVEAGYGIEVDFRGAQPTTTTARLDGPGGISINVPRLSTSEYSFGLNFKTQAELDRAVPDGNYNLVISGASPSTTPVTINAATAPRPTLITNYDALQAWGGGPVVINWSAIANASASDLLEISVSGADGRVYYDNSGLGGTATSVTITAGTLPVGEPLKIIMTYGKLDIARPGSGATVVGSGPGFALQLPMRVQALPMFSTLAGTPAQPGRVDGPASSSKFQSPLAVTVDLGRNVYVLDTGGLRKISTQGLVSSITPPGMIELDPAASSGKADTDGPLESALIRFPSAVAIDASGNFYLAQPSAHVIRKISPSGVVSTLAGQFNTSGFADGTGAAARFNTPSALAVDVAGNLYVADSHNFRIRKITPAGVVTTVAGTGGSDYANGARAVAQFAAVTAIAVDARSNVYVIDTNTIRQVTPDGTVSTLAGTLNAPTGNVDGPGAAARFQRPTSLATDAAGNIYVGDGTTLRKITATGAVSTLGGVATSTENRDGVGTDAHFASFDGLVIDDGYNIYSVDRISTTIRKGVPHPATVPPILARLAPQHLIAPGSLVVWSATSSNTLTYQWRKNDVNITGETNRSLVFTSAQASDAGVYDVVATNGNGTAASNPSQLVVATPTDPGRISNLAIRSQAGTGAQTLIVGVAIGGAGASGNKPVLIRGVGPTLDAFGVPGTLTDPQLALFSGSTKIGENDDWGGNAQVSAIGAQVGAFGFSSATSKDAAFYNPTFALGSYTVSITGANGGAGVALAEIYDATPGSDFSASTPRLTNVSARTDVGVDSNVLIAGFVIGGQSSKTVLVRAVGPSLTGFGVTGALADPRLDLFSGQSIIDQNDDWAGGTTLSDAFTRVGAFALPGTSRDAALLVTLAPGNYTAQVSGTNRTTGVALVEVYEVP